MSTNFKLAPGTSFELKGERWDIQTRTTDGKLVAFRANDNRPREFTSAELDKEWLNENLRFTGGMPSAPGRVNRRLALPPFDTFEPEYRAVATRAHMYICAYIRAVEKRKPKRRGASFIDPILIEVHDKRREESLLMPGETIPHRRQFYRWLKTYDESGQIGIPDIRIFLPGWTRCGNLESRFAPKVEDILDETARALTFKETPENAQDIWDAVRLRIEDEIRPEDVDERHKNPDGSVRIPGVQTVRRRLALFDLGDVTKAQKGENARDQHHRFVERGQVAFRPMEVVEIDSTTYDLMVIDYKTGVPLGRPTMTMAMCRYTRVITGIYFSFNGAGGRAVSKCMHMSMIPKHDIVAKFKLKKPWLACGHIGTVAPDNGPEYKDPFYESMAELGIDVDQARVRKPKDKARIERAIGAKLHAVAHKISGTTFSNVLEKGDYKSKDMAAISLEHLVHISIKWVVEVHNQKFHNGIHYYPNQKWLETPEDQMPGRPPMLENLDLLLTKVVRAQMTRNGIRLNGLRYADNRSLSALRLLTRPDKEEKVRVRFDEDDLSKIWVWDSVREEYFMLPCVYSEYVKDGMSLRAHMFIVKRAKARSKKIGLLTQLDLFRSKQEIRDIVKSLVEQRKYSNRKFRRAFDDVGEVEKGDTLQDAYDVFEAEEKGAKPAAKAKKRAAKQARNAALDEFEANFDLQEQALDAEIADDDVVVED
jgi:putative transposase